MESPRDCSLRLHPTNGWGELAAEVYTAASANGEWSDLLASIRVCRMPLNWLGNLLPGVGSHELTDGMADWSLHTHDQNAEAGIVGLQSYGEGQFCYTAPKLDRYLSCYVPRSDDLQRKIDALIAQYRLKTD